MAEQEWTDLVFHALSDATRRDILRRSMFRDYSISGHAAFHEMSFAAVQKHVSILEQAGLITKLHRGREQLVRGNTETIRTAYQLLEEFEKLWRDRIDRMGEILAEDQSGGDL